MKSSPVIEIPTDLLDRWRALQQRRASRAAGRCDCQCRRCTIGTPRSGGPQSAS